jgi:hypothetical protein
MDAAAVVAVVVEAVAAVVVEADVPVVVGLRPCQLEEGCLPHWEDAEMPEDAVVARQAT